MNFPKFLTIPLGLSKFQSILASLPYELQLRIWKYAIFHNFSIDQLLKLTTTSNSILEELIVNTLQNSEFYLELNPSETIIFYYPFNLGCLDTSSDKFQLLLSFLQGHNSLLGKFNIYDFVYSLLTLRNLSPKIQEIANISSDIIVNPATGVTKDPVILLTPNSIRRSPWRSLRETLSRYRWSFKLTEFTQPAAIFVSNLHFHGLTNLKVLKLGVSTNAQLTSSLQFIEDCHVLESLYLKFELNSNGSTATILALNALRDGANNVQAVDQYRPPDFRSLDNEFLKLLTYQKINFTMDISGKTLENHVSHMDWINSLVLVHQYIRTLSINLNYNPLLLISNWLTKFSNLNSLELKADSNVTTGFDHNFTIVHPTLKSLKLIDFSKLWTFDINGLGRLTQMNFANCNVNETSFGTLPKSIKILNLEDTTFTDNFEAACPYLLNLQSLTISMSIPLYNFPYTYFSLFDKGNTVSSFCEISIIYKKANQDRTPSPTAYPPNHQRHQLDFPTKFFNLTSSTVCNLSIDCCPLSLYKNPIDFTSLTNLRYLSITGIDDLEINKNGERLNLTNIPPDVQTLNLDLESTNIQGSLPTSNLKSLRITLSTVNPISESVKSVLFNPLLKLERLVLGIPKYIVDLTDFFQAGGMPNLKYFVLEYSFKNITEPINMELRLNDLPGNIESFQVIKPVGSFFKTVELHVPRLTDSIRKTGLLNYVEVKEFSDGSASDADSTRSVKKMRLTPDN